MLPGAELMACQDLAVPAEVMQHVVRVESSFNPYAIGVVGGHLARQPRNLGEALSTARMLEREGYNFSLGIAQVNRHNLASQGLDSYEKAFQVCPNLQAGARILAECYGRSGHDWGKAFSCYYSGNFTTGFRHGYVQKVVASWRAASGQGSTDAAIPVVRNGTQSNAAPTAKRSGSSRTDIVAWRIRQAQEAAARLQAQPAPRAVQPAAVEVPSSSAGQVVPAMPAQAAAAQPSADEASAAPVLVQPAGVPNRVAGAGVPQPATQVPEARQAAPAQAPQPPSSAQNAVQRDAAFVF